MPISELGSWGYRTNLATYCSYNLPLHVVNKIDLACVVVPYHDVLIVDAVKSARKEPLEADLSLAVVVPCVPYCDDAFSRWNGEDDVWVGGTEVRFFFTLGKYRIRIKSLKTQSRRNRQLCKCCKTLEG